MSKSVGSRYNLPTFGYKVPFIRRLTPRCFRACLSSPARLAGNTEALLELALVRKYFERTIRDLRLFAERRKLPTNKTAPFWVERKQKRRYGRALLAKVFRLADGSNYTVPKTGG